MENQPRSTSLVLHEALAGYILSQPIVLPKKSILYEHRLTLDLCTMVFSRKYWLCMNRIWSCHLRRLGFRRLRCCRYKLSDAFDFMKCSMSIDHGSALIESFLTHFTLPPVSKEYSKFPTNRPPQNRQLAAIQPRLPRHRVRHCL